MKLENITLAKGCLSDRIYIGQLKHKNTWAVKKDITNEFIDAVIDRWAGCKENITDNLGNNY